MVIRIQVWSDLTILDPLIRLYFKTLFRLSEAVEVF